MPKHCSSCGVGGELEALPGTPCAFCKSCAMTVRAEAKRMDAHGDPVEEILRYFSLRYNRHEDRI